MAANNLRREERSLQRWLRRRHPRLRRNGSIVLLPKRAGCFGGKLLLSLPLDFRVEAQKKGEIIFAGDVTGLRLTVMRMPFRRPLRSLTAIDLQLAFMELIHSERMPELKRGYLRHSPTLTAVWQPESRSARLAAKQASSGFCREQTVLHLIQVGGDVFLMLFQHLQPESRDYAAAMIHAASVQ